MKCIPTTFSGRWVWAAIAVMLIEEVLVARIVPGAQDVVELLEDLIFQRRIFADGFYDELASAQLRMLPTGRDRVRDAGLVGLGDLRFFDELLELGGDLRLAFSAHSWF